ncbi:GON domain-containing protein [Myxococcus qinghaiensis]|uniref:GON domain-containing protein n=1 Tax=Myxococcus qinghaiensis TaxID=2906758 RepID=UPI0020A7E6BF|nr:GON domain-containing protein [Myxococcus qinghaiensis]MCP3167810.1 hypothetical protein [Myxococcus qinghaiensis]
MRTWKKPLLSAAVARRPRLGAGLGALFMGLVALSTGCGEAAASGNEETFSALAPQDIQGTPATCQDVKNANPSAEDGEYTLYFNGYRFEPWTAWCHDMAGTPTEYLTLKQTGTTSNYSQYTVGGETTGETVRTTYFKLRIDPLTLRVNTSDQRFASSTGGLYFRGSLVSSMPYASAMSCDRVAAGGANLDLRDTPFTVAVDQFSLAGYLPFGGNTYSQSDQVVDMLGGGWCGSNSLTGLSNPSNQNGGLLQLNLTHNKPRSCEELKNAYGYSGDDEYTLYINGNPNKPWQVWCRNMAGAPLDYLVLRNVGASNYSQYTAGGSSPGSSVRTSYSRLRIDPLNLYVIITDRTFTTSTGGLLHANRDPVNSMPYATAMSCDQTASGMANLDLRGTSFSVSSNPFALSGYVPVGNTHVINAQVFNLTGGGWCGWNSVHGFTDPLNGTNEHLPLVYTP